MRNNACTSTISHMRYFKGANVASFDRFIYGITTSSVGPFLGTISTCSKEIGEVPIFRSCKIRQWLIVYVENGKEVHWGYHEGANFYANISNAGTNVQSLGFVSFAISHNQNQCRTETVRTFLFQIDNLKIRKLGTSF